MSPCSEKGTPGPHDILPSPWTHQQAVHVLGASHQGGEGSQLLRQRQEDLILIVDGVCQEGQKLAAGPLHPEGQGDGGQLLDAVEAELTREQKRRGMSASPDGTRNHMCVKVPNSNLVTPTK